MVAAALAVVTSRPPGVRATCRKRTDAIGAMRKMCRTQVNNTNPGGSVTQRQIAEHLGLHRSTVTLALRDDPRLRPETIARIKEVAAKLGYDPAYHELARRLSLRHRGIEDLNQVLALVIPDVRQTRYFAELYLGQISEASDNGFGLLTICETIRPEEPEPVLPPAFARGDVDGLVLFGDSASLEPVVKRLRTTRGFQNRPIVTVMGVVSGCAAVYSDDRDATLRATRCLLELGHRHVGAASLALHQSLPHMLRSEGLRQAYAEAGLDPDRYLRALDRHSRGSMEPKAVRMQMRARLSRDEAWADPLIAYLRDHPQITALLAANDVNALWIWHLLQAAGLRVPEDISVVGFDDVEPIRDHSGKNILSSVGVPLEEIGRESIRLLLGMLAGEVKPDAQRVFPASFRPRASIGPPREGPLTL